MDATLAATSMKLGGQTLFTVGTCMTSVGILYGVNRASEHGISAINSIPEFINRTPSRHNREFDICTNVAENTWFYLKISGIIACGVGVKTLGNLLQSEGAINFINAALYKN